MSRWLFSTTMVLTVMLAGFSATAQDAGSKPLDGKEAVALFDGKTFNGWEGNLKVFRIEDGAIVGGSLDNPQIMNEFLCTTRQYGDFELTLKFKLLGKDANGGVQFRSRRVGKGYAVIGYQADLAGGAWGRLWEEGGQKRPHFLAGTTGQDRQ